MNNTSYTLMPQASCLKVGECSETKPALERPDGVHLNKEASAYRSVRLIVQTAKTHASQGSEMQTGLVAPMFILCILGYEYANGSKMATQEREIHRH
jgi:hypothetical protein